MANKRIHLIRHAQPDYPGGERMCLGQKLDLLPGHLAGAGCQRADRLTRIRRQCLTTEEG